MWTFDEGAQSYNDIFFPRNPEPLHYKALFSAPFHLPTAAKLQHPPLSVFSTTDLEVLERSDVPNVFLPLAETSHISFISLEHN